MQQASSITKYLLSRWPRSLEDYHTFRADKARPLEDFTIITDPYFETNKTYIHGRWYFEPTRYRYGTDGIVFSNSYADKGMAVYALKLWLNTVRQQLGQ